MCLCFCLREQQLTGKLAAIELLQAAYCCSKFQQFLAASSNSMFVLKNLEQKIEFIKSEAAY
jgi:hypothetical protein